MWIANPHDDHLVIGGIDEAGRGPIIGPMVIAGVIAAGSKSKLLVDAGVNDSKRLTPRKREKLYPRILEIVDKCSIQIILPDEIDTAVLGADSSLNTLETAYFIKIIKLLAPDIMYVDAPGRKTYYQKYISGLNPTQTQIIAENKADTKFPVVAAASVLAKVTRDALIADIHKEYGDCGSGYPSPKTNRFLEENYLKYPHLFRRSYRNYQALL